ncbi:MAG: 23S rRNA (adenine(2503)-C(2))-methyltransferase RlmN [Aquificaceae bacterium]
MKVLTSYTIDELAKEMERSGMERFRAFQVFKWIYKKFQTDFDAMTDISKEHRKLLRESFLVHPIELETKVEAEDSTKYIFRTLDGHAVETVLIKERDHLTLCVSSQIGCAVGCKFCATAMDGLIRNLRVEEILDQLLQVQLRILPERIRNVVFMGMGEPLANYENIRKAIEIFISPWGLDLSKRRVSISTSGLIPQIKRMIQDQVMRDINLAVSINAPFEFLRASLMPISKTNTLGELMEVLKNYPYPKGRKIMLEYVMIKDVNDSVKHAQMLVNLIGEYKRKFKVNLIPYNPSLGIAYERPAMDRVYEFQRVLLDRGISAFVRISKGFEIFGACGQLRSKENMIKLSKWEEKAGLLNLYR